MDDKVLRLLRLARRLGALDPDFISNNLAGPPGPAALADAGLVNGAAMISPDLLRRATAASFVLLRNEGGALPLDPASLSSVTVTGPNAFWPTIQGGGSAGVMPSSVSVPADAITAALAGRARVHAVTGCETWEAVPAPPPASLTDPVSGQPGLRLEFLSAAGQQIRAEHRTSATLTWWEDSVPAEVGWGRSGRIVLRTVFRATWSGPHLLGVSGIGGLTLWLDDKVVIDETTRVPEDPVEAITRPGQARTLVGFEAGQEAELRLEFVPAADGAGPLGVRLGIIPASDATGTAGRGGGRRRPVGRRGGGGRLGRADRERGLRPGHPGPARPPGRAHPPGGRGEPADHRGGQRRHAGADALGAGRAGHHLRLAARPGHGRGPGRRAARRGRAGRAAAGHAARGRGRLPGAARGAGRRRRAALRRGPAGRLPRLRRRAASSPATRSGTAWATPPGPTSRSRAPERVAAGRTWTWSSPSATPGPGPAGRWSRPTWPPPPGDPGRPALALAAFGTAVAEPGATARLRLRLPARSFARWDEWAGGWVWPAGRFQVHAGRSARDLRLTDEVRSG